METATPASEESAPTPMSDDRWRGSARRLLVVVGLTAVAIAQPTLDLLGGSPSTFQVNRVEGAGILAFAFGVVIVPPLVLWAVPETVRAVHRGLARWLHVGVVALLAAMFAVLTTKEITDNAIAHALAGMAVGALVSVAYVRVEAVGTWLRFLALANIVVVAQFAFFAPVADWIGQGTQEAIELDVEFDEPPPPVVMIVFDEWSTRSILADDESIDAARFPNLAAFAETSTWYRRFTTVSPFTQSAVPALLDGRDPYGQPTWNDHPDSLFSLLAGSHHLTVAESITQMCGFESCGVRPMPPPEPDGPREDGTTNEPEVEVDTGPRWRSLLDSSWEVWSERVSPGTSPPSEAFDDFVEQIEQTEGPSAETVDEATETTAPAPTTTVDERTEEEIQLERFFATLVDAQPTRHELFVDALRPTDQPFFAFLHLLLPHQPWVLRENGVVYDAAADRYDYNDADDAWPVRVSEQRYLLQAEYADRLLGVIFDRLKEIEAFDDSLIVVAADHGVAFAPGEPSRRVTETNLEQVVYSPLLIKAPGQSTGRIDDANVNSTDVAPTVADLLGLPVPWETDGHPVGSAAIDERGGAKYVHSFTDAFDYEFLGIVEYDDADAYQRLVEGRFASIGADEDRLAGLYRDIPGSDLIGDTADDAFTTAGSGSTGVPDAFVEALDRLLDPPAQGPLLGEIAGRVTGADPDSTVLVAVNERIVGVSPLYVRAGREGSFVVLLPADALERETNRVRVALRTPDGTITELPVAAA